MKYHTFRTRHVQATYALMSCKNNNECNLSVEKPFHVRSIPCSFFRLKKSFQVKNGVTTSFLFFFFENAKNLGRLDDGKRRKKRGWSMSVNLS